MTGIRHWLVVGLATAAALTGMADGSWSVAVTLVLLGCAIVVALPAPEALVPALFPLVFMLPPASPAIGWREGAFAAVALCAGVGTFARHHRAARLVLWRGRWWLTVGAALVAVNGLAASTHGVSLADWLRGLAPFMFLLVAVPATVALRQRPALVAPFLAAAMIAAILFAGGTLAVYLSRRMWVPTPDFRLQVAADAVSTTSADALVDMGIDRVTFRFPHSIDVLLPLAFVWAAWAVMWARQEIARWVGAVVGAAAGVSVLVTYTRSMVLIAAVTGAAVVADGFLLGRRARAVQFAVLVAIVAGAAIWTFNLQSIYGVRALALAASVRSLAAPGGAVASPSDQRDQDPGVSFRLQEFDVGWRLFLASPVYGQGLGVRHPIRVFSRRTGIATVQMVGYLHNWLLYMLMVGGVVGAGAYAVVLFGAPVVAWRRGVDPATLRLVVATVLVLATHGMVFAVFRLIPFNLVLGGIWAVALAAPCQAARA